MTNEGGAPTTDNGGSPSGGATDPGSGGSPTTQTDCYSPTQNLATAYEPGAAGCPCDDDAQGVCIPPAALICDNGSWQAVEDGPCFPIDLLCEGRVADVSDCLTYFDVCVELSTGLFCGMGARTDECMGEIVQDPSGCLQDDAFCTQLPSGLYCTGPAASMCPESYVPGTCPEQPVFWCLDGFSESLDCELGDVSDAECTSLGGEAIGDPGDGSVSSVGCPDARRALGFVVPGGIEGTLCCELP